MHGDLFCLLSPKPYSIYFRGTISRLILPQARFKVQGKLVDHLMQLVDVDPPQAEEVSDIWEPSSHSSFLRTSACIVRTPQP